MENEENKYPSTGAMEALYAKAADIKKKHPSMREKLQMFHDYVCLHLHYSPDQLIESPEFTRQLQDDITLFSLTLGDDTLEKNRAAAEQQVLALAAELLNKSTDDVDEILKNTKPFE